MRIYAGVRALLLGWVIGVAAPAYGLQQEPFFKQSFLNLAEDLAEAHQAGKFLMILYEQEGCPYCAKMHKAILSDREVMARLQQRFDVVQLDMWGDREVIDFNGRPLSERTLARRFGLQFSPMTLIFDRNGKEIYRMAGFYNLPHFKIVLSYVADNAYQRQTFPEYQQAKHKENAPVSVRNAKLFQPSASLKQASMGARKNKKGVALLIDANDCADCVEMHERSLTDPVTARLLTSNYVLVRATLGSNAKVESFDGRRVTANDLARQLNVRYLPTVVFMDANGKETARHESYLEPKHFQLYTHYVTSGAQASFPSFQDWIRARNSGQIEKKDP